MARHSRRVRYPRATEKIKFAGRTDYSLFRELYQWNEVEFSVAHRDLFENYLRLVDNHLQANEAGSRFPALLKLLDDLAALRGTGDRPAHRQH